MSFTPDNALLWSEIPVRDLDKGIAFYSAVFDFAMQKEQMGPNETAMFPYQQPGSSGHLYPGEPAKEGAGPTVHLAVPDTVEATAKRCEAAGGKLVSPIIEIPIGRFQYATDPDGNSIAFFEMKQAA